MRSYALPNPTYQVLEEALERMGISLEVGIGRDISKVYIGKGILRKGENYPTLPYLSLGKSLVIGGFEDRNAECVESRASAIVRAGEQYTGLRPRTTLSTGQSEPGIGQALQRWLVSTAMIPTDPGRSRRPWPVFQPSQESVCPL